MPVIHVLAVQKQMQEMIWQQQLKSIVLLGSFVVGCFAACKLLLWRARLIIARWKYRGVNIADTNEATSREGCIESYTRRAEATVPTWNEKVRNMILQTDENDVHATERESVMQQRYAHNGKGCTHCSQHDDDEKAQRSGDQIEQMTKHWAKPTIPSPAVKEPTQRHLLAANEVLPRRGTICAQPCVPEIVTPPMACDEPVRQHWQARAPAIARGLYAVHADGSIDF